MSSAIRTETLPAKRPTAFCVSLIFLVKDQSLLDRIRPDDYGFGEGSAIPGHEEVFRFLYDTVRSEEDLELRLAAVRMRDRPGQFLLVSDALTARDPSSTLSPNALTARVRESFRTTRHLCGLVALADPPVARVHDVDMTVPRDVDREGLRAAILHAATALRVKAPPPVRTPAEKAALKLRVQAVQSEEELRACLELRKRIYGLMGYLPDKIIADRSGIEMDGYDLRAIHFAALSGTKVVGTARMITDLPADLNSVSGFNFDAINTQALQRKWLKSIARSAGGALRDRALNPPFFPLPILQSTDFQDRWAEMLEELSSGAELSRLVVEPAYRGLGISTNLVRAVTAKAFQMGRQVLLLECIPAHVPMYARYSFKQLSSEPHSRPTDLDQYAVAMSYQFDEGRRDKAEKFVADLKMRLLPSFGPFDVENELN